MSRCCEYKYGAVLVQREGGDGGILEFVGCPWQRTACEADRLGFLHDWVLFLGGGVDEPIFNRVNPPEGGVVSGRGEFSSLDSL